MRKRTRVIEEIQKQTGKLGTLREEEKEGGQREKRQEVTGHNHKVFPGQ